MRRRWAIIAVLVTLAACGANPVIQNNTGNEMLRRGRIEQAVRAYQSAQVSEPDLPVPYFNAGVAFLEAQEYGQAQATLEQALESGVSAGEAANIHFALGEVFFRQGQYREAANAYREVLLRDPNDEDARYNMELALSMVPTPTDEGANAPTPTATQPSEDQTTPTQTPSPTEDEAPQQDEATGTPTPSPVNEESEPSQTPQPDDEEGDDGDDSPMPLDEAEQILNDMQEQQNILIPPEETAVNAGSPPEKDW